MKSQPPIAYDDALLAVVERTSDTIRAVLVRKGATPSVVAARAFGAGDWTALHHWLDEGRCNDLRIVLPTASVLVRTVLLPNASQPQMLAALGLQAEGFFLGSVPQHRLALAVAAGHASPTRAAPSRASPTTSDAERREFAQESIQGFIIAWPTATAPGAPGTHHAQSAASGVGDVPPRIDAIARYLPEPAALLPLASGDLPVVVADSQNGAIAIAMRSASSPHRVILRATREESPGECWSEGLRRAIAETALNADVPPAEIADRVERAKALAEQAGGRILIVEGGVRNRLASRLSVSLPEAREERWWQEWSIVLGAAVTATGPLADLCRLRRHEAGAEPTPLARLVERYSNPTRSVKVLAAVVALLIASPIAFSWLRMKVYEWKMPVEPAAFERAQRLTERRISHYDALASRALPVTKLLGDLAVATPDGIEIESLQLSLAQGVTIRGVAKPQADAQAQDSINLMQRLMDSSGVFRGTVWNYNQPDARNLIRFNMTARIGNATRIAQYEEARDWSIKTLAQRKFPSVDEQPVNGGLQQEPSGEGIAAADGNGEGADPGALARGGNSSTARSSTTGSSTTGSSTTGSSTTGSSTTGSSTGTAQPPARESTPLVRGDDQPVADPDDGPIDPSTPVSGRGIGRRGEGSPSAGDRPVVSGGAGAGAGGGPAAVRQASIEVPPAVTDDELKGMSRPQLQLRLNQLAEARKREDLDDETRARVVGDFRRVLDALRAGGS